MPTDLTQLLHAVGNGDHSASAELLPMVYEELRKLAAARMARERSDFTLQPTALVHEAWLRLGGDTGAAWHNRGHFFAAAAEAMRRILIDRARRRRAAKRGEGEEPLDIAEIDVPSPVPDDQLLAVNEALERFEAAEPRKAQLVKLRYFVGMTFEEASAALGIAVPTAKQWWSYARAWLTVELRPGEPR